MKIGRASCRDRASWAGLVTGVSVEYHVYIYNTRNGTLSSSSVTGTRRQTTCIGGRTSDVPSSTPTCVVGPITAQSGTHSNTAKASATFNSVTYYSADSTASYFGQSPSLTIAK